MPQASLTVKNPNEPTPLRWKQGAVIPAFVAMLTLYMFRTDQHRWLPALFMEGIFFTLIPVLLFWLIRKWANKNPKAATDRQIMYFAQASAFVSVALLIGWQVISRNIGLGDANEIVALMIVQIVSWNLAVFASVRGFEKASFVLCGALVFFICCMTKRIDIFVTGAFFAVASLWWMAGIYWSKLDSKAIDGNPKMLAIHGSSTAISVVIVALVVGVSLLIPFSRGQFIAPGFSPFSGGENGYQDEFASSGIGDGNMLMAGNNATTTGAVDTDQFIEDNKPSLYDVMTDKYEGPAFKKKRNRAIALQKKAKHIHDVKQSEQAGKTFRTMRNSERELDIEYEDRISNALFFVEGTVPARFTLDSFHHFDGWDWTKVPIDEETPLPAKIRMQKSSGKPVFKLSQAKSNYLTGSRFHRVKIMRLDTASLPAPCFLDRWRIPQVDKADFFRWDEAGVIRYVSEAIPEQTVIDFNSFVPNYHVMREASDLRRGQSVGSWTHFFDEYIGVARGAGNPSLQKSKTMSSDPDSPFLQVPDNSSRDRIAALAKEITTDKTPGWNQVEAIVNHLRNEFEYDAKGEEDESAEDTVGHFLDQNGGPSYMFATSCAMLLRESGYRTRLASGFLVRKKDYVARSRQSIVTKENLHMWPEVCLDGKFWIPLEPTPGFPIPYSTETLWQWTMAKVHAAIGWVWNHPLLSLLMATLVTLCYRYWANLITSLMLGWWNIVRILWPPLLLRTTRQLIDLRFWAAGDKRPRSRTIRNWYTRNEPELSTGFFDLWNANNYCSSPQEIADGDLIAKCREQVQRLTLGRIQQHKTETTGKGK